MSWMAIVMIGLGGAAGAILRALAGRWIVHDFPIATLLVNVTGSFLLAAAVTLTPMDAALMRAFMQAGFCGAFTTFSTFILETAILARSGFRQLALLNIVLTLGLCSLASWLGIHLMA